MPFPVLGCTTFYQVTPKTEGLFELTLTLLTSDDISFGTGLCINKEQEQIDRVFSTYNSACGNKSEKASLVMSFLSTKRDISGDEYLRQMDLASGGVPNFGAVASGDKDSGEDIFLIYNGKAYLEGFAILLFFGEIDTKFYLGNINERNLVGQNAVVTKSDGVVLKEINNMKATDFIERNGVILHQDLKFGALTVPFLFNYKENEFDKGHLISRIMYDFNSDGEAFFMGEIPENTSFHLVTMNTEDILDVTKEVSRIAASENHDASVFFVFSCVGRCMALCMDTASELVYTKECLKDADSYIATYAFGEICPLRSSGKLVNMYHNYSIVICAIK